MPRRKRSTPAQRLRRVAFELVAVAPGAPNALRRLAGLPLDNASGAPLGLTRQLPQPPKGQPMETKARRPEDVFNAFSAPIDLAVRARMAAVHRNLPDIRALAEARIQRLQDARATAYLEAIR